MNTTCSLPDIPALVPAPAFCAGATAPVLSLDGNWQFLNTTDYEKAALDDGKLFPDEVWGTVPVPSWISKLHTRDFCGAFIYRRMITVTEEMARCRVVLRMEGVNGFATVYVNRQKIISHQNSQITWNAEITKAIRGLTAFDLTVTVDDRMDTVGTFNHGGISHSVYLYLLPETYVDALHTTTTFDKAFQNATLRVDFGISTAKSAIIDDLEPPWSSTGALTVQMRLLDTFGAVVEEGCRTENVINGHNTVSFSLSSPFSWDAEHPRLYTIELSLYRGELLLEKVKKDFGFRQITRQGNRLFINGKEVKLHGACRHEVSPFTGRSLTRELIEEDVRLFKEANCNYIRTSHYPPSEYFLELCDRFGIYVEDELDLAFIAKSSPYTQQDPRYTERYLSHFAELLARDYSHPSVIIWSLSNESFGGYNFDLLNRFAKASDPTRVTKFSYPMTIREEYEPVDIWSIHYSSYDMDLAEQRDNVSVGGAYGRNGRIGKEYPVIHDEYVHIPCYNRTELRRDPGVREYWGESLACFWDKIWRSPGALGGSIWAGVDETDVYVGGKTHLEWGIIDIWRRKKPEHYGARKAYSPILLFGVNPITDKIALESGKLASYCGTADKADSFPCPIRTDEAFVYITAENRFCHTDFSETTIRGWYLKDTVLKDHTIEDIENAKPLALSSFEISGPNLAPFKIGEVCLPFVQEADSLYLEWTDAFGVQVDEFLIQFSNKMQNMADETKPLAEATLHVEEDISTLTVTNSGFSCSFDKATGLFRQISRNQIPAVTGGPWLHTPYLKLENWTLWEFSWTASDSYTVTVISRGTYGGKLDSTFCFVIYPDGDIMLSYRIDGIHTPLPHQLKLRVGTDCGGLDELGITLEAAPGTDSVSWERKGPWSVYPAHSIGRNEGTAALKNTDLPFAVVPVQPWKDDSRHDILYGPFDPGLKGTNDFCSIKANITKAAFGSSDGSVSPWYVFPFLPDGSKAPLHLRAEAIPAPETVISCQDARVTYTGTWYPMADYSSESTGTEMWSNEPGASAICTFEGTGIVWYAPVDVNYGYAAVYVDGIKQDVVINQRVDGVDFPGSAAGYDKKYHFPVYSVQGLFEGQHTLKIEVLGSHASDSNDSYIVLETFVILTPVLRRPVRIHLLSDYNYPHISWGNRYKPAVFIKEGDETAITLHF